MAAQDEREPGGVVMCNVLGPMVQDTPEQDWCAGTISLSQTNPEPEMGAAAAAKYDTSPSLFHQNPSPIPAQMARPSAPDMAQLFAMLAGISGDIHGIKTDVKEWKEEIKNNTGIQERYAGNAG